MPSLYELGDRIKPIGGEARIDPDAQAVEVLSTADFDRLNIGDSDALDALRSLSAAQSSYVDVFPGCMIGSLSIPDKSNLLNPTICFGFYLDKTHLIFVDDGGTCKKILDDLATVDPAQPPTVARVLYEFFKYIVKDDTIFLGDIEEKLADTEENILGNEGKVTNNHMLRIRRKLLRLDGYYQQLSDLSSVMSDDENHMLSKEERRLFHLFSQQTDRLMQRAQSLKDYSLQLRELYQMQIDTRQSETMQWFTVITTIFVPLTLITSWYGMNFENMPEVSWPYSYLVVIVVCVVLVIIELRFFRKKHWL